MAAVFFEKLLEDIKSTMKARDNDTLVTLRSLHARLLLQAFARPPLHRHRER